MLLLGLAGCVTRPPADAMLDPAFEDTRYDGFLVYAAFDDLGAEARFERESCKRLIATGHACTTLLAAAPPTRAQNARSRHEASRRSGAQAIIVIELADPDTASRRLLAGRVPGFEVTLIDNESQQVVLAAAVSADPHDATLAERAHTLADSIVALLEDHAFLR
ncbi:hypothetical protein T31B1_05230 [Salinisphaera sp. T31B1]